MSLATFGLSLVVVAGCGGVVATVDDGGIMSDSGLDARDSNSIADAGLSFRCQTSVPVNGTVCGNANLQCEYGAGPRPTCNTVATCTNHMWSVVPPTPGACAGLGSQACPIDDKTVPIGQLCKSSFPAICSYTLGYCSCDLSVPDAGDGPRWSCDNPRAGCDAPRPHLGKKCATQGLVCDYSVCTTQNGVRVVCDVVLPSADTVWQQHPFTCP